MPYYREKNILFIHIPKTGGSVIEDKIKVKYNQSFWCGNPNRNSILPPPYNNVSPQHLSYSLFLKHKERLNMNFDNIKVFSVVRNPYDRIISDLFWYRLIRGDFNKDQVYDVIKNNYLNRTNLDNHNIPQYTFVTNDKCELFKNIKIFKTETLNESNEELNKFLGFDINIKKKSVNKDYSKYLNEKSISLINEFYKKDFEIFGYELK